MSETSRPSRIIELKSAYCWYCDDCSEVNFDLPKKLELNEEQRLKAYRQFSRTEDWEPLPKNWRDFEIISIPDTVKCKDCGAEFRTVDERDVKDEDF